MDDFELHIPERHRITNTKRKEAPKRASNDTTSETTKPTHTFTAQYERIRPSSTDDTATTNTNEANEPNDTERDNITEKKTKKRRKSFIISKKEEADNDIPEMSMPLIRKKQWRIFLGIASLIVGGVMLFVLMSHLKDGAHDQTNATSMTVEQAAAMPDSVDNAGGSFGAWLSQVLFTESLGLGSLVLAAYLIIISIGFFGYKHIKFWSLTAKSLILAISTSIVTGLVTFKAQTAISLGGTHGHEVNAYLMSIGGPLIAIAVSLILVAAVLSIYLNDIIRFCRKCNEIRRRHIKNTPSKIENTTPVENVAPTTAEHEPEHEPEPIAPATPDTTTDDNIDAADSVQGDAMGFDIDPDPAFENGGNENTGSKDNTDHTFTIDAPKVETIDDGKAIVGASGSGVYADHRAILPGYSFPPLELLKDIPQKESIDQNELQHNKDRIVKALADHKITIDSIKATVGPTVTLYEIVPSEGIRIASIKRLEDDIAMSLAARGIRIIAPMPGKGTVGIEVPNSDPQTVSMRSVLSSKKFREYGKPLPIALGATISNDIFVADLAAMPHVLVAGATGQGKSVGLNAIIASLLYKKHPTELKFVLIDPKEVEFSLYAKLEKHYLAKLPGEESAIVTDFEKVLMVLNSLCVEMDNRYGLLREAGVRTIAEYNDKFENGNLNPDYGHRYMPYIVVIIDEFADLIMTAGKEIELPVTRITQKARAVGIHMVIATQRPSTNVLTGLIKSNCPARIAFRTIQMVDSRVILDRPGANQLIGRGDMLYSQGGEMERVQCAFISTGEVENLVNYVFNQTGFTKAYELPEPKLNDNDSTHSGFAGAGTNDRDPLFEECARFIITQSTASTSSLQRRFQIGYNRAGKIIDQMEACGIVGPASGNKPRQIKMDAMQLETLFNQ